jgi:hypothetical protein
MSIFLGAVNKTRKLTAAQVKSIKSFFNEEPSYKYLAIQGNISELQKLSMMIGEKLNYSIVQKNLKQLI